MKILFLTQYYPPETGAPQNRLHSLALNLKKMGIMVEVLTAMPNYPKMEIFPEYQGIRYMEENIDGLRVVRSSIYVSKDKGIFKRLLSYFSFVFSSMRNSNNFKNIQYILCESPPLFLGISALYLTFKFNAKLIFNVSDLWPESAKELNIVSNKFLLGISYRLEAYLYKQSHLITCQTRGIENDIQRRFPTASTMWLPNGIDADVYDIDEKESDWLTTYDLVGKHIYMYAGTIGYAQGLDVIIKADNWLKQKEPHLSDKVAFVIIGDGPDKDRLLKMSQELNTEVKFIPNTPKSDVIRMVKQAAGYIVPLKKLKLFLGAVPSKIFDPLALQIPILLGVDGEARRLFIEEGKSGLYFKPEDHVALAKSIMLLEKNTELARSLGKQGYAFIHENFDRSNIAKNFKEKLDSIL